MNTPPTAELHLHIEGTFEPEQIVAIAARNRVSLPTTDVAELRAAYAFADLQSFLDLYYANLAVLRTEQDFFELATAYLDRAAVAHVRRAEIFFDPQVHLGNGVALEAVIGGLSAAIRAAPASHDISADLILCFLRDLGPDAADEMLTAALPYREAFIGVGLDSAEVGYPPESFADVYARAAAEGLHLVAHAGEEGGPENVAAALDMLHVERIDHGIRAMEDPTLVARLRDDRVPLTVCPLSNVALRAVPRLAEHPLPQMLDAGILVSVHSDDPPYFGGYVDDNYTALRTELALTDDQLRRLAVHSFESAFIEVPDRRRWIAEVEAWRPDLDD